MKIQSKLPCGPIQKKTTLQTRQLSPCERVQRFVVGFFAGITLVGFCCVPVCRNIGEALTGEARNPVARFVKRFRSKSV